MIPHHGRRTALGAAALMSLTLLVTESFTHASAKLALPPDPRREVLAIDDRGHLLGHDPTLTRGERVTLAMDGFRGHTQVQVRLIPVPVPSSKPNATASGALRVGYQIPRALTRGHHTLSFVGLGPRARTATTKGAGAVVTATVPSLRVFEFEVA